MNKLENKERKKKKKKNYANVKTDTIKERKKERIINQSIVFVKDFVCKFEQSQ